MVKKFLAAPKASEISKVQSALDKAVKKGILHKNRVARMKSQMSKKVGQEVVKKVVKKKVTKKPTKKVIKKAVK